MRISRFKANRWLSEEKDDQKTYIDLLVEEPKTPPISPVLKKGEYNTSIFHMEFLSFLFRRASCV